MIKNVKKALTKVLKDFKLIHTYIHTWLTPKTMYYTRRWHGNYAITPLVGRRVNI